VCPICPLQQRAAGLLLWARWVGDIDRVLHDRHRSSMGPQHGTQQLVSAIQDKSHFDVIARIANSPGLTQTLRVLA